MRRVVENLNVGENKIRIGVVQYGDSPNADMYLNTHATKEGVLNGIKEVRQRGGRQRNLGQALEFVSRDFLTAARGSRKQEGVPQFVVVVSSGSSTDDVAPAASTLKSEFPSIREMIRRVIEKLDVGLDNVRISVVQYSDDPHMEFLLNQYSTKDEVRQAVTRLRSIGGSQLNTGRALDWVSKHIYQRSAGSRIEEAVPQFLILVTGGKSTDDVTRPAHQLKRSMLILILDEKTSSSLSMALTTQGQLGSPISVISSSEPSDSLMCRKTKFASP
ncbi:hypothetical protein CRUP_010183 [Coryphaenoides rupestris]|nr:hypothetical protein CRUP_010183 [Coryphaenoides rupestris]